MIEFVWERKRTSCNLRKKRMYIKLALILGGLGNGDWRFGELPLPPAARSFLTLPFRAYTVHAADE